MGIGAIISSPRHHMIHIPSAQVSLIKSPTHQPVHPWTTKQALLPSSYFRHHRHLSQSSSTPSTSAVTPQQEKQINPKMGMGMGISGRTTSANILMALLLLLLLPSAPVFSANLFSLVYKGCANQTFGVSGGGVSQQSMAALSSSLISQSAKTKFFKTSSSSSSSLFGLFQCRGDLTQSDCSACVSHLPAMWVSLCGQSVAVRVQLNGCYGLYEVSGFPQVAGTKMLYKYCSSGSGGGSGFEEKRGTALAALQSGVVGGTGSAGSRFYATSYGSVYAMAQCEGDLSVADCGECVAEAVQKAEVECGGASAGQMYLARCYITYSYYSHGVPKGSSGAGIGAESSSSSSGGSGQPTGKTVAIVVGGAAGVGFLVICLLFVRSLYKKDDD